MSDFSGYTVIITGATGGVGKALAQTFTQAGATACLLGRSRERLETLAAELPAQRARCYTADLTNEAEVTAVAAQILRDSPRVDVLIHCAAALSLGPVETAPVADFEEQLKTNVLAPYRLTQLLLKPLTSAQGQIVFINSTAGLHAKPNFSQYSATKHALKALADSLRDECNAAGVRVTTLYPGNIATKMQQELRETQGRAYQPETIIQPQDIAALLLTLLALPRTVEVTDVIMRPMVNT